MNGMDDAAHARAVEIAGALAERGVQRLQLVTREGAVIRELHARVTDLPRVLIEEVVGAGAELVSDGVRVRWTGDAFEAQLDEC